MPAQSVFRCQSAADWLARLCFVGIFVVENVMHFLHFDTEIEQLVQPAWAPLPQQFAVILHSLHIVLGLLGACFVLVSGLDAAGRTALRKGSRMMMVFMLSITWTWWVNRGGVLFWDLDVVGRPNLVAEKRNRLVHILKNISIFGGLNLMQRLAIYDEKQHPATRKSPLEGLVTSLRVWTFSACAIPILLSFAVLSCKLGLVLRGYTVCFSLLVSLMAVQGGANLLNSYCDFRSGCDTSSEQTSDRTLVDRLITPQLCLRLGVSLFGVFGLFLLYLIFSVKCGLLVLLPAFVGTVIALFYSAGPYPLKYHALGDVAILVSFGPCLAAFAALVAVDG